MKKEIRIAFKNFWRHFDPERFVYNRLGHLAEKCQFVMSDSPDFVVYSSFERSDLNHDAVNIFWSSELEHCRETDFSTYDWAFGVLHEDQVDLPHYMRICFGYWHLKERVIDIDQALSRKDRFCNFVYLQQREFREEFFKRLSRYKHIDSPGVSMNNMSPLGEHLTPIASRNSPDWECDKLAFLRRYRFTIAFEHTEFPYHLCEKLPHALEADSIPIYWGNPVIHTEFNTKRFLNFYDYGSMDGLIEAVREVDMNEDRFRAMLSEPIRTVEQRNDLEARDLAEKERWRSIFCVRD